jgi:hypothetical protein
LSGAAAAGDAAAGRVEELLEGLSLTDSEEDEEEEEVEEA